MGLSIRLEDERGEQLEGVIDPHQILLDLINAGNVINTCCLRFIDPYGDTVFNRVQMAQFMKELGELDKFAKNSDQLNLLSRIKELTQRCSQQPHLYIKIYGD